MAYIAECAWPLIKAFQESKETFSRMEKARQEEAGNVRIDDLLDSRTIEIPGKYRIVLPKIRQEGSLMKSDTTPGMTRDEAADYLNDPMGTSDAIEEKSKENESQFDTLRGRKAEKKDVQIADAKKLVSEAVRRRISRDDAMKAVSRAVRSGAITLQESEVGMDRIRTGKISPEKAIRDLTSRVQGINRQRMLENAPRPKQGTPKYNGLGLKGIEEYNRIVSADPLALVRM